MSGGCVQDCPGCNSVSLTSKFYLVTSLAFVIRDSMSTIILFMPSDAFATHFSECARDMHTHIHTAQCTQRSTHTHTHTHTRAHVRTDCVTVYGIFLAYVGYAILWADLVKTDVPYYIGLILYTLGSSLCACRFNARPATPYAQHTHARTRPSVPYMPPGYATFGVYFTLYWVILTDAQAVAAGITKHA